MLGIMPRPIVLLVAAVGTLVHAQHARDDADGAVAPHQERCVAAIALRDDVPGEQKLGTQLFTVPILAASYARWTYITADANDDGRAAFIAALSRARDAHCGVDLWFLAHGHPYVAWFEALRDDERPALHLVYDTGGASTQYGERWIAAGARTFVGHPGGNVAPVFYARFLPRYVGGEAVADAVRESNSFTRSVIYASASAPLLALAGVDDKDRLWFNTEAAIFGDGELSALLR